MKLEDEMYIEGLTMSNTCAVKYLDSGMPAASMTQAVCMTQAVSPVVEEER